MAKSVLVTLGCVNAQRLGSVARVLRIRLRLTQGALALRAGVSRQAVSLLERGESRSLRIGVVEAALAALGARVDMRVLWNGPDLDRLLDAGHAALTAVVKRRLERLGWVVRVEVSFNHFGERGRIDVLAWHPATGILLVVEIKTDLVDVQSLLGTLDAKTRIASTIAKPMGWNVTAVIPAIVFAEDRTIRRHLARLDTLFDRFALRGRAATNWLRHPVTVPRGLLWFSSIPRAAGGGRRPQRVRRRRS